MKTFWLYFTNAYGTLWFIMLLVAVVTMSKINAGTFGLLGFPFISLLYALYATEKSKEKEREKNNASKAQTLEIQELKAEIAELRKKLWDKR